MNFDAVVAGLPLVLVVIGLVEWVKRLDVVPTKWLPLVSMLIGLILGGGYQYSQAVPVGFNGWFALVVYGLGLGLVASGIYDAAKSAQKPPAV